MPPGESLFFAACLGVAVIAMGLVTFGQNVPDGKQATTARWSCLVPAQRPSPSTRRLLLVVTQRRGGVTLRFPRRIDVVLCA